VGLFAETALIHAGHAGSKDMLLDHEDFETREPRPSLQWTLFLYYWPDSFSFKHL